MISKVIEIKTMFSGWKEVSKETAKKIIDNRLYNLSSYHKQNTFDYINNNLLRGIKVEQLFDKDSLSPTIRFSIYGE